MLAMLPILPGPAARAQEPADKLLAGYRNKNRVLLVFAPDKKDVAYQEQMKLWQNEKAGFADRDLVVVPVFKEGTPATTGTPGTLAERYAAEVKSFRVMLIGKDGHEAYQSNKPVTAEALYLRIDAMPMRRDEMKRRKAHGKGKDQEKSPSNATPSEI